VPVSGTGGTHPARLLFLVNDAEFFISHRANLAAGAREAGMDVVVACPPSEPAERRMRSAGWRVVHTPSVRTSHGLISAARVFLSYLSLFRSLKPDIVHLITSKPIIFGGLVARFLGVPSVAAVSGLGFVFTSRRLIARLMRFLVVLGYAAALNRRDSFVVFQNNTDRDFLARYGAVRRARTFLVRGSGTDLGRITPRDEKGGPCVALLPARVLRDKGVVDFAEAARLVRSRRSDIVFRLQGKLDLDNPSAISQDELDQWIGEGLLEYRDHSDDVCSMLAEAHIIVLPSHREGFPKTLIDAAAAGRAAVATDVPGCRDAVVDGQTGVLVPPHDPQTLAKSIEALADDPEFRARLGKDARRHAETHFDAKAVTERHLAIYAEALATRTR
jgi:glycosyltransferase involved in cell wall biosynthesis